MYTLKKTEKKGCENLAIYLEDKRKAYSAFPIRRSESVAALISKYFSVFYTDLKGVSQPSDQEKQAITIPI